MTVMLGVPQVRGAVGDSTGAAATQTSRPSNSRAPGLLDSYGRVASDLRISLTDKCNLRCTYCMPAEGLPFLPTSKLMQRDEIVRLARLATEQLGVRQVRFTGGEPLLRKDLVEIIRDVAALDARPEISLTTNAIGLSGRAAALAEAGLDRVNVSLDSICPETFAIITRRPFLERVLKGIDALGAAGIGHTKINAVLIPKINDTQGPELLEWALAGGHQLRFIEQMPLDADHIWNRDAMITAAEIRRRLSVRFDLTADEAPRDGAPAELYQVRLRGADPTSGSLGTVGIIASVTEAFCDDCRRTRLTAEGAVRSCLFSHTETDLLAPMRAGASDAEVADLWRGAMWAKPSGHGMSLDGFQQPDRPMSAIGG
ncbi:GTP 3',8-cyclase MoaA [Subtercola lobariae]|uniref:GTP 3',8-cyclase n=1 Tax=Subtercola lobariae TaxID=1588641 RepID=A0A917F018_9MICO|nr:GTP 3',8-cyclase MoaA [Subtercola lobariae]GGF38474.1 cyclic pyranopterin monophosphate synthase [Subtercola lobariae]